MKHNPFGLKFKIGDALKNKAEGGSEGTITSYVWDGHQWLYTLDWKYGSALVNLQWFEVGMIEMYYELQPQSPRS